MIIHKTKFKGVYIFELKPHFDERGFFMRTYDEKNFCKNMKSVKNKGSFKWVQENHSKSIRKGVIRGLHFQFPPYSEAKLIRCVKGIIQDVYVDLRLNSKTFGKWGSVVLSEDNFKSILIPRGFAHGFCTLTKNSEIIYKHDNFYNQKYESGIIWNDKDIGIEWECKNPVISERDKSFNTLDEFFKKYKGLKIE